jgi:hypothetical protein
MRQRCPLSLLFFNIILEFPAWAIQQEDEIKGIQIGNEEVRLSLFADDVVLYVTNLLFSRGHCYHLEFNPGTYSYPLGLNLGW